MVAASVGRTRVYDNVEISGNQASNGGGISGTTYLYDNALISGNQASSYGGGIQGTTYLYGNARVTNNTTSYGGGINGSTYLYDNAEISNNHATKDGGGIYLPAQQSNFGLHGGRIVNNTANGTGGGVMAWYVKGGVTSIVENCEISGNTAGSNGGGIYYRRNYNKIYAPVLDVSRLLIQEGTVISDNTAVGFGGGVALYDSGAMEMSAGTITGNRSGSYGGGIYIDKTWWDEATADGTPGLTLSGGAVYDNQADTMGNDIFSSLAAGTTTDPMTDKTFKTYARHIIAAAPELYDQKDTNRWYVEDLKE